MHNIHDWRASLSLKIDGAFGTEGLEGGRRLSRPDRFTPVAYVALCAQLRGELHPSSVARI